ncbi:putative membrane protein [Alphaentomopoxvirus acuprea]|uniref:Putative membrane protein n=1 Tax=Alphaentomopoxvirus acuprea TaxID=62099 RepID=W6JIM7_9POXV|nr:hypothetical protein BA82_gp037 [Anomala cuprea entomopoxvirus]BAO49397.1 putative membrane protein [Anomala cuprea entomopoxvirus]
MGIIKSDNKVINLNPTFIIWDYDVNIIIKNYSIYLIIMIEICFIIFILYYFYIQEIIFIYNYIFGVAKSLSDKDLYNILDQKIQNIINTKLFCDANNNMKFIFNGNEYYATSLNGDQIVGCSDILK